MKAAAPARLFRYHKPAGLLTAERDPKGRPTIYDRLPEGLPRLMPVGRLDMNTEGLLLLTTDGEFKRQLELPATGVERSYRARAFGDVTQDQLEDLIHGIEIEGIRYGAIDANLERRTGRNQWIEMRLREGKNREVRRVLEHLDLKVSRLIRTAYGPFALGDLAAGAVDEVRQHDLVAFRKILGSDLPRHGDDDLGRATSGRDAGRRSPSAKRSVVKPSATAGGAATGRPVRKRDEQPLPRPAREDRNRTGSGSPKPRRPRDGSTLPGPAGDDRVRTAPGSSKPRRPRDGANFSGPAGDGRVRTAPGSPKPRGPRDGSTLPRPAGDDRVRTAPGTSKPRRPRDGATFSGPAGDGRVRTAPGSSKPRRPRDGAILSSPAGDDRVRTAPGSSKLRRPREGATTSGPAGNDRVRAAPGGPKPRRPRDGANAPSRRRPGRK